jgi:hypothetical protein
MPYMMLSVSFMLYDDDVGCIDPCTNVSHTYYYCHQTPRYSIDVSHLLIIIVIKTLIGHFCEGFSVKDFFSRFEFVFHI